MAHLIKNPPANAGDTGWIPGSGRSREEENGNQSESSMDRGTWQATVHEVTKVLNTTEVS